MSTAALPVIPQESKDLIFDVGAHLGEDSEFYLGLGCRVVAVEASPKLAECLRARFAPEIACGRYILVPKAIDQAASEIEFYVNDRVSVWGTTSSDWARRNEQLGAESTVIRIPAVPFESLLNEYGVPYYLKVDIEGADLQCVKALRSQSMRPKYLSLESTKTSWQELVGEFDLLESLGYHRFKVVNQRKHTALDGEYSTISGGLFTHRFPVDASGPFGEDLPGHWLTRRQALARYRWIFLMYRLVGDNTWGARLLKRIPLLRRLLRHVGWYDTHACFGGTG